MGEGGMEMGRVIVFASVMVIAPVIGMVLYHFSQQSQAVKRQQDAKREEQVAATVGATNGAGEDGLMGRLLREMESNRVPPAQRQRLAAALSDVVNSHVEQQLLQTKQELSQQYDKVVQEKSVEIKTIKQKQQETMFQKEQTESVIRSMAEGLVVVNGAGEVVFLNPAAEKLLGVKQQEKLGQTLDDGLGEESLVSLVKGQGKSNESLEIELNARQDQTKRVVRSSNAVIEDENGRTVGMVSVLTDVTKQRELDRLKSDFVSSVTHELRTPLVAIQHSLGVMLDGASGDVTEQQRNFLQIAQRNLGRLSGMINDLLDLAKLEAGRMDLKREPAALAPVVDHAVETLEAWAKSKSVRIETRIPEDLPQLSLDPGRIEQVLNNLIGNAVKFTPKDGIVTIEATLSADQSTLDVGVSDTGVGIADEDLPKLFKKFQQVGTRRPGDLSGTGLGLAISKEIVELHGGAIRAERGPDGKGARFVFRLPLADTAPPGTTT
jgi:PAS domain S-box-containing protein